MTNRLFVGGLPWAASDRELGEAFAGFGKVTDAKVILDRETGKSRGFGFVTFSTEEEAKRALEGMDGGEIAGRRVTVREAQDRGPPPRGGGPGRPPAGPRPPREDGPPRTYEGGPRPAPGPRAPGGDAPRPPRDDAPRVFRDAPARPDGPGARGRPAPGRGKGRERTGPADFGEGDGGRGKKARKERGGGGRREDFGDDDW